MSLSTSCKWGVNNDSKTDLLKKSQNELIQRKTANDVEMTVQYLPPLLKLLRLKKQNGYVSEQDSISCFSYDEFKVTIHKNQWKPENQTMEYLSFKIGNDFVLLSSTGDSISSSICERMVTGSSETHELLMSFEAVNKDAAQLNGLKLIYKDQLLGTGTLEFIIPAGAIKKYLN